MTRVYEALAGALADEGVDTIFCVLGDGNLDLLVELAERHAVRLVHARHEQGATAMADGYARRTGRIGVCSVTHGPGLTQTATSLRVAVAHGSRLLVLAGNTPAGDPLHIQGMRQAPFVEALGARHVPLRTRGRWRSDLAEAIAAAAAGRPTVFGAATDLQMADVDTHGHGWHPTNGLARRGAGSPTAAAESGLDTAVDLLSAAQSPVIIAGRGALGAVPELLATAAALDAPVVTTLGAKGLAGGDARLRGLIGGLGEATANATLGAADCVLAVGASLNPWSTKGATLLHDTQLIQIDAERENFGRFLPTTVALWGDAGATLRALTAALPASTGEHRRTHIDQTPEEATPPSSAEVGAGGGIDPRRVFAALEASLPRERTLVLDGGHFITFACSALSVSAPEKFIFSCDFATIGQGLATAIGAAVAVPNERTTLIAGDGGLLMSIAELDTAVRYRLPLTIAVINDEAYGQEVHSLAAKGLPTHHAVFEVPDLGALGRAYGADGHLITDAGDLDRLPELLNAAGGPRVIDIRVDSEVVSDAANEIFRQVREGVPT